ncbi:MAG: hypothetical protein ACR2P8_15375 [Myxococcota bacterium]
MIPSNLLFVVGWGSVGVLVLCWLVLSFLAPGGFRAGLARLATSSMYLALLCLFVSGLQGAEGLVGRIGFGFLAGLFGLGLLVSLWKLLRPPASGEELAAH